MARGRNTFHNGALHRTEEKVKKAGLLPKFRAHAKRTGHRCGIDMLLCQVHPKLEQPCFKHYVGEGPALADFISARKLSRIDRWLAMDLSNTFEEVAAGGLTRLRRKPGLSTSPDMHKVIAITRTVNTVPYHPTTTRTSSSSSTTRCLSWAGTAPRRRRAHLQTWCWNEAPGWPSYRVDRLHRTAVKHPPNHGWD